MSLGFRVEVLNDGVSALFTICSFNFGCGFVEQANVEILSVPNFLKKLAVDENPLLSSI